MNLICLSILAQRDEMITILVILTREKKTFCNVFALEYWWFNIITLRTRASILVFVTCCLVKALAFVTLDVKTVKLGLRKHM